MRREYSAAPLAPAFMARAILAPRRPGLKAGLPSLEAIWRNHRVDGAQLDAFLALTGLEGHPLWPLLYPHVAGFRLPMSLLTDFSFPFPIWGALQVRNRIVLHEPFKRGETLELSARVADARVLDKGAEIDVACAARRGGTLVWESVNSFYYRGRFGAPQAASPLAAAPTVDGAPVAEWTPPPGSRVHFGRLTGDYNGIHLSDWYARLFGFRGAFHHPQRVLGQCLARLPRRSRAQPVTLDAWLKGPVYYGPKVMLRASADGSAFALFVQGDERPAILGRLR
jgi:acyl dehydratase